MSSVDWLLLYLASFAANILVSAQLLFQRWIPRRWLLSYGGMALGLGSLIILAADAINLLNSFQFRKLQPLGYFPLLFVMLGSTWLFVRSLGYLNRTTHNATSKLISSCCILTLVVLNVWCWQRIESRSEVEDFNLSAALPGELVQEMGMVGATRAGNPVALFRLDVGKSVFDQYAQAMKERESRVADPLIDMAEPSMEYNCHGWVFTGGKFFIRGSDIPQILKDNCYTKVDAPKENDIVLYRSALGNILHTGLVRTVLAEGIVLIESKWGASGRYLHKPENQPYSQTFEYYRGGSNHIIQISDLPEEHSTSFSHDD